MPFHRIFPRSAALAALFVFSGVLLRGDPERAPAPGEIRSRPLYLEAPATILSACPRPDQRPLWRFQADQPASLPAILSAAAVPLPLQEALLATGITRDEAGNLTLVVPPELVLRVPAEARQTLYTLLARNPANPFHAHPVLIPGDLEAWLAESRLSTRQRGWLRQLTWRRGNCTAFSDVALLVGMAGSAEEENAAISTATRVRALVATVTLPPRPQQRAFLDYWTAGGRNPDAMPFLRAALDQREGSAIDLIHLLPSLCRDALYTYPSLADATGGRLPDCQWTSLNFFSPRPAPYYLDPGSSYLELTQGHDEIPAPERLGDLICYVRADGSIVHSCVHLAADLVFTKNGSSITAPWLLQSRADVDAVYLVNPGDHVRCFRRKDGGGPG